MAELEAAGGVGEEEVEGSGGFGGACHDGGYGCALSGGDAGGYCELGWELIGCDCEVRVGLCGLTMSLAVTERMTSAVCVVKNVAAGGGLVVLWACCSGVDILI